MTDQTGPEQETEHKKQVELVNKVFEGQLRLYGALYEKAATYTNLILVVGYAGFFGLWSLTRLYLSKPQALLAASLMLLSLAIFVFFEVYKGAITSMATQRRSKTLFDGSSKPDAQTFIENIQHLEAENLKDSLRLSRVWPWTFEAAVIFGFAGIAVLLFSLVSGLVSE